MAAGKKRVRHLSPTIILAAAFALLVAGMAATLYGESSYRQQKIREVTAQAQILAASITAALQFEDRQALQEYVHALTANPEITDAAIYDIQGTLTASYAVDGKAPPEHLQQEGPL